MFVNSSFDTKFRPENDSGKKNGNKGTKINENDIVLVEIHPLDAKYKRLPDRFIQEIVELLRETIISRFAQSKKKNVQQKGSKDSSGILTGTNVRVGYSFKNRPGHQICTGYDEDQSYLNVVAEKLIAYVQLLDTGSPKGISQLLRRLSDVKHPAGPSVSISSYFQKMSSSQRSQGQGSSQWNTSQHQTSSQDQELRAKSPSQGDNSGPEHSTQDTCSSTSQLSSNDSCANKPESSKPKDPPCSEGRRNKIKSILGRYRFPGKKKKRLNTEQITNSEDQDSCDSIKSSVSDNQVNHESRNIGNSLESMDVYGKDSHKEEIEDKKVKYNRNFEKEISSDDLSVSEKETYSSDDILEFGLSAKSCSITVNTNMNESHTFTVSEVKLPDSQKISVTIDLPDNVKRVSNENNFSDAPSELPEDDKDKVESEDKDTTPQENAKLNDIGNGETPTELKDPRSSSSDNSPLPSASFCYNKSNKRFSQIYGDALRDILNNIENKNKNDFTEPGSPVFKGNSGSNKHNYAPEDTENVPGTSKQVTSKAVNDNDNRLPRRRLRRFKRKLPKFSDSDSEDSLPEQKRQNTAQVTSSTIENTSSLQREKLKNLTNMNNSCKRLKISKDFFTERSPKSQPKLTLFTRSSKDSSQGQVTNAGGMNSNLKEKAEQVLRGTDEDFPDLDTELIEELSDIPRIKSEADIELLREVRSLSGVEHLNEEQIRFLIRRNETLLRQIFEGKTQCERHQAYKAGGITRRNLIYASRLGPYTDEQIDVVMEYLISVFCKKHHKYFDYVMKVLLPEMLIQFHMEVHDTTYEESDRLLGPKSPEPLPTLL